MRNESLADSRVVSRARAATLVLLIAAQSLLLVQVLAVSRLLRPLDDDYCIADRARAGFLALFFNDPDNTASFLTPSLFTDLLVGQPLNHVPLGVSSSITFWAAALAIGALTSVLLIRVSSTTQTRKRLQVAAIGLLLIPAWWGYQWASLEGTVPNPSQIALAVTHWQNINSAYVAPTALLAALTLLLAFRIARGSNSRWNFILATFAGVGTGLMSPVYSISVISVTTLIGVFMMTLGKPILSRQLVPIYLFTALAIAGALFSLLNPSSADRLESYSDNPSLASQWNGIGGPSGTAIEVILNLRSLLVSGFAFSLQTTRSQVWTLGSLLVVGLGMAFGFVLSRTEEHRLRQLLALATLALLWTAFISNALSSIAGSVIGLSAYYHSLYGQVFIFGALVAGGLLAGLTLRRLLTTAGLATTFSILVIALVLEVTAIQFLADSIYGRHALWQVGPAPIEAVGFDREQVTINACWRRVANE